MVGHCRPAGRSASEQARAQGCTGSRNPPTAQRSNPMTGLDLESFLLLLRADLTTWVVLGLATLVLALMVWSCWRSRRALRNCLVLSLAAHLGLVLYGSTIPAVMWTVGPDRRDTTDRAHTPPDSGRPAGRVGRIERGTARWDRRSKECDDTERWDLAAVPLALADASLKVARPRIGRAIPSDSRPGDQARTATGDGRASLRAAKTLSPTTATLESRPEPIADGRQIEPATALPPDRLKSIRRTCSRLVTARVAEQAVKKSSQVQAQARDPALASDRRLARSKSANGARVRRDRNCLSPTRENVTNCARRGTRIVPADPTKEAVRRPKLYRPRAWLAPATRFRWPGRRPLRRGASGRLGRWRHSAIDVGGQGPIEIPKIYQPRLEPDRSSRAQRIGASAASELAVERALDWLTRHQDDDGRWDGGIARYEDGTPVKGDDDFTVHCPAGETCSGECAYWEADTALTGLALLTYLGAGYTHRDGRYAEVVGQGPRFLDRAAKARWRPSRTQPGRRHVLSRDGHSGVVRGLCPDRR